MNTREAYQTALELRENLQDEARQKGIDEEFISRLVDDFYLKVRGDPILGPIFDDVIQDNWPEHLLRMKKFWASMALRTGDYKGKPMVVHRALKTGRPEHFGIWLALFEETLDEISPTPEAKAHFMDLANVMAVRLSSAMFGERF